MTDTAANVMPLRGGLQGLPQRLVSDGLVAEAAMVDAINVARERRVSIVSYLVEFNLADSREIAIAASHEFGARCSTSMPSIRTSRLSAWSARRPCAGTGCCRWSSAASACSSPSPIPPIFTPSTRSSSPPASRWRRSSSRRTSFDKLLSKAIEQVDTAMPELAGEDFELDSLEVTSEDERADEGVERADVEDAPIVRFVNKVMLDAIKRGASDIHFEPYERSYRIRFRLDGVLKEVATPPVQLAIKMAPASRSCPGWTSPSGASRRTAASR